MCAEAGGECLRLHFSSNSFVFGLRSYGSSAYLIHKRLSVSNSPNTQLEIERATQAKRLAQALAAEEIESSENGSLSRLSSVGH